MVQSVNPERFISCCEWCGKDTARYGRWELRSGEGIRIILCSPCADWYNPDMRKILDGPDKEYAGATEMVPCHG